jgi:hypothetical protein
MALTIAYIGKAGTSGGNSSIALASYNQPAGETIVIATEIYDPSHSGALLTSLSDTAGNTYLPIFAGHGFSTGGTVWDQLWYCANCLGNAANVIQANYGFAADYCTMAGYHIGGGTNILPDVSSTNNGFSAAGASANYTTTAANEALIAFISTVSGALSASAVDSSFTLDDGAIQGNSTNLTGIAHLLVTSIQTAQHVTFTNTNTNWNVIFASFKASAAAAAAQPVVCIMQ